MASLARAFCSVLMALAVGGCVKTLGITRVIGQPRPGIDPSQVLLYSSPPPNSEFIAVVTARSTVYRSEQEKMDLVAAKLREEAAGVGANGVVLLLPKGATPDWKQGTIVPPDKIGVFVQDKDHDVLMSGQAIYVPGPQSGATPVP